MKLYPVGKYIKVNTEHRDKSWYSPDIFCIIGHGLNNQYSPTYILSKRLPEDSRGKKSNRIHYTFVIRDEECLAKERKNKLLKLKKFKSKKSE